MCSAWLVDGASVYSSLTAWRGLVLQLNGSVQQGRAGPPAGQLTCCRAQDHLAGKQYLGWLAIREKLVELNEQPSAPAPPEAAGNGHPQPRSEPGRDPDRHRSSLREPSSGHRDRDGHRERERHRDSSSHRDRDWDRQRDRSRHAQREQAYGGSHGQEHRPRHSQAPRPREHTAAAQEEGELGYDDSRQAPDARHRCVAPL